LLVDPPSAGVRAGRLTGTAWAAGRDGPVIAMMR
jgi:hypothetical protein